ncbi:hypothetical protein ACTFIU_007467 [Dictyostelium citrinum]
MKMKIKGLIIMKRITIKFIDSTWIVETVITFLEDDPLTRNISSVPIKSHLPLILNTKTNLTTTSIPNGSGSNFDHGLKLSNLTNESIIDLDFSELVSSYQEYSSATNNSSKVIKI